MSAEPLAMAQDTDVFLRAYLAPFKGWLSDPAVTEVIVNRPGEVWVERSGAGLIPVAAPEIDDILLQRLAEQVARISHQGVNRERPLLGATIAGGTRVQFVAPSATRDYWAMAMRRHHIADLPLDAFAPVPVAAGQREEAADPMADPMAYLRRAVRDRRTILISGGTSSGKTSFLNALLREVPDDQRIILVEDTPEIRLPGPNGVGLVAVKGDLGEAQVTTDDLLQAALRLRPDRIVLGELRGVEAVSFLRAINTGHPGSFTTIHANSPEGALEQLALMVMQAGLGLGRADTLAYARSVIDVVVQLRRHEGVRGIAAIRPLDKE